MSLLVDVADIRIILLHNGANSLLIFNRGYIKEPGARVYQVVNVNSTTIEIVDVYKNTVTSDIEILESIPKPRIGLLELCVNGAAKKGYYFYNAVLLSSTVGVASREGYNERRVTYTSNSRILSNVELVRGSRNHATEA